MRESSLVVPQLGPGRDGATLCHTAGCDQGRAGDTGAAG